MATKKADMHLDYIKRSGVASQLWYWYIRVFSLLLQLHAFDCFVSVQPPFNAAFRERRVEIVYIYMLSVRESRGCLLGTWKIMRLR